jgi:ATP-dependent Clp protease adaptor protein ClpS
MSEKIHISFEQGFEVRDEEEVTTPPRYRVYLLNDDYTTMEFVVHVLERIFHKNSVEATQIMLHVHKNGKGLAGVYTHEIAETKVASVHELALKRNYPLKCSMERE